MLSEHGFKYSIEKKTITQQIHVSLFYDQNITDKKFRNTIFDSNTYII